LVKKYERNEGAELTWMKIVSEKENFMGRFFHHLLEAVIVDPNNIAAKISNSNFWQCKDLF
jgi:hypothetical protein